MACVDLDRDQTFIVHDFGPRGHVGDVTINLTYGLQPGAAISAVILPTTTTYIAVRDAEKKYLFSFGIRLAIKQLAFNSQIDGKWETEVHAEKCPWKEGLRGAVCLFYDSDGYRVFVNGESVIFYKHRSNDQPSYLEINNGQVFKTVYQTTINVP